MRKTGGEMARPKMQGTEIAIHRDFEASIAGWN